MAHREPSRAFPGLFTPVVEGFNKGISLTYLGNPSPCTRADDSADGVQPGPWLTAQHILACRARPALTACALPIANGARFAANGGGSMHSVVRSSNFDRGLLCANCMVSGRLLDHEWSWLEFHFARSICRAGYSSKRAKTRPQTMHVAPNAFQCLIEDCSACSHAGP